MSKRYVLLTCLTLPILACLLLGCDSPNIVEPRFYFQDDIVEIADNPSEDTDPVQCDTITDPSKEVHTLPREFSMSVYWRDRARRQLMVYLSLPMDSEVKLAVIGRAGQIIKAFVRDPEAKIGNLKAVWCGRNTDGEEVSKGIYGVTVRMYNDRFKRTVWFEIK